jgi:TonB family protein
MVIPGLALTLCGASPVPAAPEHFRFPKLIYRELPRFPEPAVRAGVRDATVLVQIMIRADGTTLPEQALNCSHPMLGFEEEALRTASSWLWNPALSDGRPVEVHQMVPVRFHREQPDRQI